MTDDYRNQWDGSRDPDERFVQQRVGLHHLCLRARSRERRRGSVGCRAASIPGVARNQATVLAHQRRRRPTPA